MPCGVCRQVLREFCDDDFRVLVAGPEESMREYLLCELFPAGFGMEQLQEKDGGEAVEV